jgi:hypothetical protein
MAETRAQRAVNWARTSQEQRMFQEALVQHNWQ